MQFVVLASLFAAAMASPAMVARTGGVCQNGLYTNFQCCSVNALNILALDCSIRMFHAIGPSSSHNGKPL